MTPELAAVLRQAWALLADGGQNPGSAWRNLALATAGLDGMPQVRTVVLRRSDEAARELEVHTDRRSAKHAELLANPRATLHGWDAAARVQLRAAGTVRLHQADPVAASAWQALRPASRATYLVASAPGTPKDTPADSAASTDEAAAQEAFCVVRLTIERLDYLHLQQGSHRRARFVWAESGAAAMWLVP